MDVTYRLQLFAIFNYNRCEPTAAIKGTHRVGFTDCRKPAFDRRRFICGDGSCFEGFISKQDNAGGNSEDEPDYQVHIALFHHFKKLFLTPGRESDKCEEQHIRNAFSVRKMKEKSAKTGQHLLFIGRIGTFDQEQASLRNFAGLEAVGRLRLAVGVTAELRLGTPRAVLMRRRR